MNNASVFAKATMDKPVFESDFLTNDSLAPTFVFCLEGPSLKRPAINGIYDLHQTRPKRTSIYRD
jgi:hypothetical protein